jgi:hypothetical protein
MNTQNILCSFRDDAKMLITRMLLLIVVLAGLFTSCEMNEDYKIEAAGPLSVNASKSNVVLVQKEASKNAVSFNWSTGTNNGTGAAISYLLQVDKKGNNFTNAITIDMGKNALSHTFSVAALNDTLVKKWNATPNTEVQLEARVVATIYSSPTGSQTSNVAEITVIPYQPVSKTLYIIGGASPNGWDAGSAIAMTPLTSEPTTFVYQGALASGELKFITTQGQFLPSYNKGADDSHIVYRTLDTEADEKFTIAEAGVYKITVSLLDLTISFNKMNLPPYSTIYMVGSAAPNGWDISNSTPLVQDSENPFIFRYKGVMNAGDFKFPVNQNSDWGQDMYMKTDDTHMYLHKGGASDDNKWSIAKKGYYTITLNLLDNTIAIDRLKLYMVGSATTIGWDIGNSIELTEDANDGCIFTYIGPMVAGEFKFPVNRNSDWGQDMYMRTDNSTMYHHVGGASDDNKWNITADGDYIITANVETLSINIQK